MSVLNFSVVFLFLVAVKGTFGRSFTVDYEKNCFLKDGECFRYMSGSIHYFRVPNKLWEDRLQKMKMAGLNAIQTYVEWSGHEPEPGKYNFKENYDLPGFLKIAQKLDLLVVLRTGPFIDAERDMGGLPYWLLREGPDMKLRTMDTTYLKYMDRWFSVLLPLIEPFLYNNGGPIITVQIENEYGSFGCDSQYKTHIRDLFKKLLKNDVVLFTTDGSSMSGLTCGHTDQVLSTIDFGSGANVTYNFEMLRWTQTSGPLVNSEFYPGWLDHWGQPHAKVSSDAIVKTLTEMLKANASVNVYMFHGGTSFGFTAGSNLGGTFQACPTSYDYDAPLNEAGDPTPKYFAMRDAIGKFFPLPPGPLPQPSPKMGLYNIPMKMGMSLWDYIAQFGRPINSTNPLSFEDVSHPYGFVLYSTTVKFIPTDPALLTVKDVADRAYVYVDKVLQGILSREQKIESLPIKVLKGQKIDILVENQGRVCFGSGVSDRKGIFQNVTLGTSTLSNWTITPIDLNVGNIPRIHQWSKLKKADKVSYPAFFTGSLTIPRSHPIYDTYLSLDGWHKGVAFLNAYNLGRYWPVTGPQITLYAPKVYFEFGSNSVGNVEDLITVLELENSPCSSSSDCQVQFVDTPNIDGPTPT